MTRRFSLILWAAAFLAGLLMIYAVYAFGEYAICYTALWSASLTGFLPNAALRAECWSRTIEFPFSFFR